MFKLSSDHLANFRGVQSALQTITGWINDIRRRFSNVEERIEILESTPSGGITLPIDAVDVDYDNATSGLTATDVQAAIDELAASGGGGGFDPCWWDDSRGNLTASSAGGVTGENINAAPGTAAQLITHGVLQPGGKYYFEFVQDVLSTYNDVGVSCNNVWNFGTSYAGQSATSYGYWNNGYFYNNAASRTGFATFVAGDIIGCAVDTANGKIWWAKNNVWVEGDPATGATASYTATNLTRALVIHGSPYDPGNKITLQAKDSQLTYAPPSGFSAPF